MDGHLIKKLLVNSYLICVKTFCQIVLFSSNTATSNLFLKNLMTLWVEIFNISLQLFKTRQLRSFYWRRTLLCRHQERSSVALWSAKWRELLLCRRKSPQKSHILLFFLVKTTQYTIFPHFSCRFLNPNYFFPIWVTIVPIAGAPVGMGTWGLVHTKFRQPP